MKILFLTLSLVASVKATNTFANAGVAECKASCSDGSVAVGGTGCYCGQNGTFVANDKWCYVNAVNKLGYQLTGVMCSNTDGTVAATAACKCGVTASGTVIDVAQNEFCLLNAHGYGVKLTKKVCANVDGSTANADPCTCGLVGVSRDTAGTVLTANHKCFVPANSNGFGKTTHSDGTTSSADSSPACASTDGSTAMSGATCKCGVNGVHVADTKVCLVKNSTWNANANEGVALDSVLCSSLGSNREKADGSTAVDTACTCGLNLSNGNAGTAISDANKATHKCLENATTQGGVSGGTTSTPACADTDGGTAAGAACKCGNDFAAVASGKVCLVRNSFHATAGMGVQLNTVLCSSLGSNREKADGETAVGTACTCGLDPSNGNAGTDIAASDKDTHKCLENATSQFGVSGGTTDTPACPANESDGSTTVTAVCRCGADLTNIDATTKACYVFPSTHKISAIRGTGISMSKPFCTQTDGATDTGVASCTCGLNANLNGVGTLISNTSHHCLVLASGHGIGTESNGTAGTKSVAECTAGAQTTAADGCKCGRDGVHVAQNSYCILKGESTTLATQGGQGGIASAVKPCSNTTSGAAVDAACKCGLAANFGAVGTSISDNTKFCYVSFLGVGQAEKAAAVAPAATCVNPSTATGSPAGTTAPGVFAALFAAVAFALRM